MSVSEPFVLATYTSSLRTTSTILDKPFVGAYTSVHTKSNKSDEYVTVAVQADAVHILDVSSLHPVISHTLGPSTYFSCPALTFSASNSTWTTYAIISASPQLASSEDASRTIYMWKVDAASKEKHHSKTTKALFAQGETVYGLYACDILKGRIVALSCAGDITILEAESLEIKAHWPSSSKGTTVQYAWLLSMTSTNLHTRAFMIVIYSGTSNITRLRVLAIDETDPISQLQDETIELPVEKIISTSCNPSGYLTILTSDGFWFLYNLLPFLDANEPPYPLSARTKPLRLANFSWLTASSSPSRPPVATMSLTSSHVLLATISSHEIILHIWDLQFGVLLASHNLSIPTSLASSSGLHLNLVADQENLCKPPPKTEALPNSHVSGQAYLLVSSMPLSRKKLSVAQKETKITSVVFVVPFTIPRFSTIAAAIGRGSISHQWLKDDHPAVAENMTTKHGKQAADDSGNKKLLLPLQTALREGRSQAAEAMFLKWTSTVKEKEEEMTTFGYNFVEELLTIIFTLSPDPRQRPKHTYPAQILHHILERGVATSAMLASHGGLLGQLRAHDDWKSIEIAFNKVPDLTEMELVETLRIILTHHRRSTAVIQNKSKSSDAMQVDTESPSAPLSASNTSNDLSNPMPLETYLYLMTNYPMTRIPLLLSFRRHLQDPEDATALLQILSDWFAKRSKKAAHEECHKLLPGPKDIKKTADGVWIVAGRKKPRPKKTQETIPSLEKITNLISTLLDSSFLSLLSYKPSHTILRTISEQIVPELAFVHAAQNLRGGLEPFALLQERTLRESLVPKAEKEKGIQKTDWRQRKKGFGAAAGGPGADIGIYTVEELVL